MPLIKCRNYDSETGQPLSGGCSYANCTFVHPYEKEWDRGRPPSDYLSKAQREERKWREEMERRDKEYDENRGRVRGRHRDDKESPRSPSSTRSSRRDDDDDVLSRVNSSKWRTSPPPKHRASQSDASGSTLPLLRRRIDPSPPRRKPSDSSDHNRRPSEVTRGSSSSNEEGSSREKGHRSNNGRDSRDKVQWSLPWGSGRSTKGRDTDSRNHKDTDIGSSKGKERETFRGDRISGKLKGKTWGEDSSKVDSAPSKGTEKGQSLGSNKGGPWGTIINSWPPSSASGSDWNDSTHSKGTEKVTAAPLPPTYPPLPTPPPPSASTSAPPPTRTTSVARVERDLSAWKPLGSPSPSLGSPRTPSFSVPSASTSLLSSSREPVKISPAVPFKVPRVVKPLASEPSLQYLISGTASPALSFEKNSFSQLRDPSPAVTEHTSGSVSSRKSVKNKRIRKILTLFDHAVKTEVQRQTVSKRYDRWKKIQESPQYARVRLNGQYKLDNVRSQLKRRRDRLFDKFDGDLNGMLDLLQSSASSSKSVLPSINNFNINELVARVRERLVELDTYILELKRVREEQKQAKELVRDSGKKEVSTVVAPVEAQLRQMSLEQLKASIVELEERSFEMLDIHEENKAKIRDPKFIEEALEVAEKDSLVDEIEEQLAETGHDLEQQSLDVAHLLKSSHERKEQEEALRELMGKNAQLKKDLEAKIAAMDQAAIERRKKIDDLSSQIQNLHKKTGTTYFYVQALLPALEKMVARIVAEEIKPIFITVRATTKNEAAQRQKLMMDAIERALEPIVQMTQDVVQRSKALAEAQTSIATVPLQATAV